MARQRPYLARGWRSVKPVATARALGDASPSFPAISTFCYMRYPFARRSPAAWLGRDRVFIALTLKGEDGGESALRVDGLALLEP